MKDPLIGQQISNYRIERLLGQGGMATVYYGLDVKLNRPVAIKFIDRRFKNNPVYASRFVNEARMMAKWHHENIIQIYYADDTQGYSYYAMEYVDGQDLSKVMGLYQEEGELMPIDDVIRIGKAIASGLDYAHRQGIIHRDIKPSNVLIAKDGRVLLGDFGMALDVRDGSMGNIFGTPHYISPEQARRSADAVPQSDLYSLGVILYEILTGTVPFNDPSPASIALQHISEPPPSPRSINPELSPELEKVILKALEKDPQNRYQSGAKLMAAIESALKPGTAAKISLPPLPVGVPTVRRSNLSIQQIANREARVVRENREQNPIAGWPATVKSSNQVRNKNKWGYGILLLFLIGIGSWYFLSGGNRPLTFPPASTFSLSPLSSTELSSLPTETAAPLLETPTIPPPSPAAPTVILPTATVFVTPTMKYPDGSPFSLLWNETSFYMINRSKAKRSLSAFSFERIDAETLSQEKRDHFDGYRWETQKFRHLPENFCTSITIYGDQTPPYMNPVDCSFGIISVVQPRFDDDAGLVFWRPEAGATHFRVLWLGEETARCEIAAGFCDFNVP
ncbi:MAG: serine/threonine protein kinase [Anaerolineales bacterium]|nr:serine/threonine protein kinase [Anaerolineales bacterium]